MSRSKKSIISPETRKEIDRIMSNGRTITITIKVSNGFGNTPLEWFSSSLKPELEDRLSFEQITITDSHTPEQLNKRSKLIGILLKN